MDEATFYMKKIQGTKQTDQNALEQLLRKPFLRIAPLHLEKAFPKRSVNKT